MTSIRIIAAPAGEAPEKVRRAWVGLTLPVLDGNLGQRGRKHGFGVLSGPKGAIAQLFSKILGRSIIYDGYAVDAVIAVAILAQTNPTAAQWWRENTPHLLTSGKSAFLFEAEVCELVVCEPTVCEPAVCEPVLDTRVGVKVSTLSCPNCGGQLPIGNRELSRIKCGYCGTAVLLRCEE